MKKFYFLLALIFVTFFSLQNFAQTINNQNEAINEIILPNVDVAQLEEEDILKSKFKDIPERYGVVFNVNTDLFEAAKHEIIDGQESLTILISSDHAKTLELKFHSFYLPAGAVLKITDKKGKLLIPIVTDQNNRKDKYFSSGLLHAESIVITCTFPSESKIMPELMLSNIIHGYKDLEETNNTKGCYVDINCPEGIAWQIEKKSVARILLGSGQYCTGTLINNTAQDGTKYFLTANHCWNASPDPADWDFYFNYEAATCGSFTPFISAVSGSVLRAKNSASDFCLVEITGSIPSAAGVIFAGWDRSESQVDSVIVIHHPGGQGKKISKDFGGVFNANWSGTPTNSHWAINYDLSSTEGGSSGSSLFNKERKIIGQLHGGDALCGNNLNDYYGKFLLSWDYGSTSETRLKEWLDPLNINVESIGHWSNNIAFVEEDLQIFKILGTEENLCSSQNNYPSVVIRNLGNAEINSATIACKINENPPHILTWTGNLLRNETDTVYFTELNPPTGTNLITSYIQSSNITDTVNFNDTARANMIIDPGQLIRVDIKGRKYYEDDISWSLKKGTTTIASGSGYTTPSPYIQLRITEDFCLDFDCYTFSITDNNCGGATPGYFWLTNLATGDTIAQGCHSGTTENVNFCVEPDLLEITEQPIDAEVCENDFVSLIINLSGGISPYEYQWYKDGFQIMGADEAYLNFSSADLSDEGEYYCVASSSGGTDPITSQTVDVIINPLPIISGGSSVAAGQTISLTADEEPSIINPWQSMDTNIATVLDGEVLGVSEGNCNIIFTSIFGCIAEYSINVTIPFICYPPTDIYASPLSFSQATLFWTIQNSESEWKIKYKKSSDLDFIVIDNVMENPYLLDNLDTGTEYIWAIKSICENSESVYSELDNFSTLTNQLNDNINEVCINYWNGKLTVSNFSNQEISCISGYNSIGQIIFIDKNIGNSDYCRDLQMSNNIIFIKITTEKETMVYKQFIK